MEKARDFILEIFNYLRKPEMRILPGQLAFFLVISIIPMLALIVTIAAALSISIDNVRIAISESIPTGLANILNNIITGEGINFNVIVFYFSAFLLASNGTYSMVNISNEIYKIKPKNIAQRRLKAIVMIFIIVGLFVFLIAVPVFGGTLSEIVLQITGDNSITEFIQKVLMILKYPIVLLILFMNIKLMYIIAPDDEIPSNTTNRGAIFTSIGWVIATELYLYYVILVLLLWIYLLSYIFVLGMIINASGKKREQE